MNPSTEASNLMVTAKSSVRLRWSFVITVALVLATGVVAGFGRVEFASPFLARQASVQVVFYDSVTGNEVAPNPAALLPLALEGRLGHQVNIFSAPPLLLESTLQSLLAWLCVWVALGLTGWLLRFPLDTTRWWHLGVAAGSLSLWRLLQAISISHWLLLPQGRPDLVTALLDFTMGIAAPTPLLWAVLWRGAWWLMAGLALFVHLFLLTRAQWRCSMGKAFLATLLAYLFARGLYWLATFAAA